MRYSPGYHAHGHVISTPVDTTHTAIYYATSPIFATSKFTGTSTQVVFRI